MRTKRVIVSKLAVLNNDKGPRTNARGKVALAELSGIEKALRWVLGEAPALDFQHERKDVESDLANETMAAERRALALLADLRLVIGAGDSVADGEPLLEYAAAAVDAAKKREEAAFLRGMAAGACDPTDRLGNDERDEMVPAP